MSSEETELVTLTRKDSTVLTSKDKKSFVVKLKVVTDQLLFDALFKAAISGLLFPENMQKNIGPLQLLISQNPENLTFIKSLEKSIFAYLKTAGFELFKELVNVEFDQIQWTSKLLHFISNELNMVTPRSNLIEMSIKKGKVFWRTVTFNGVVLKDHPRAKHSYNFEYDPNTCVRMSYDDFDAFKKSGKRYGNGRISRENFKGEFENSSQEQADMIWEELKEVGIIDPYDHISKAWTVLTGSDIALKSDGCKG